MKTNLVLFTVVCCVMLIGSAWAVPVPVHIGTGPGINVPFDTDAQPVTWGQKDFQGGTWSYDGDSAMTNATVGSALRYDPTYSDTGNDGPMPTNEDWVFELVYKHTGAYGSEWPVYAKTNGNNALFGLKYEGTGDLWSIIGDTGWGNIVTGITFSQTAWNTFTVHYKSATSNLDFYVNDSLVAGNVSLGHGTYDLRLVQMEWMRDGADWFQNFEVGQIPEPATMALLGLGGLALIRRRKAQKPIDSVN